MDMKNAMKWSIVIYIVFTIVGSVFSMGIQGMLCFGLIFVIYFAIITTWEFIEKQVKKHRKKKQEKR